MSEYFMPRRRFVMLDRDGTTIHERRYLSDPDEVELLPGIGPALRELARLGLGLIFVTNQSLGAAFLMPPASIGFTAEWMYS